MEGGIMWYLWLQILALLALAAVCGAGLAYWWLHGRYEDVTESYSNLISGDDTKPDLMARSDLEGRLNRLSDKLDRLENTDLSPLENQLLSLANEMPSSEPELSPILKEIDALASDVRQSDRYSQSIDERLSAIEAIAHKSASDQDRLDALYDRLQTVESELSGNFQTAIDGLRATIEQTDPVDLSAINTRLSKLQEHVEPLSSMPPQIATLSKQASTLAETQETSLKAEIARVDQRLAGLSDGVWQPIQKDLQALATKTPSSDSLTRQLEDRLRAIEEQIIRSQNGLRPINDKLDEMSPNTASIANNNRALAGMDQKLVGFESSITGIKQRMDQIGAILAALDQRVDPAAMETRLDQTTLELSALRKSMPGETSLEPLEQSVTRLQQMVFNLRERDMSTLNNAVRSIESRVDFAGVENRLTSIEYGLAATHHMLRSRLEQNTEMPPAPQRAPFHEPPQDSAFAPQMPIASPPASLDPVNMIRAEDESSNLLLEPGFGPADNLEEIRGIGPMLRQLLNDTGIFYYWQIGEWTEDDVAAVDALLPGYQGRITRDRWVEQAQELSNLTGSARRPQPFGKET